ncbi:hypothetical protein [Garciella nitratireducens]|uniref:Uncharacterized protein n=1 Tax=Garciella nitratireducens DSM 15102 TaxID=1121911 RepID=A0A1T4MB22_9FIRM|nr:hypothetical protein [Garciella nitratireducens]SJZ64219.1 hypothetical protein SAMN02745973_01279 [Garciella nitratireducens DSM 15102]
MTKLKKIFLPVLLIIYVVIAYFLRDNQKSLIIITVFFAVITSIFITIRLSKKK